MNLGKEIKKNAELVFQPEAWAQDSCKPAIKQRQHLSRESEVFLTMGAPIP